MAFVGVVGFGRGGRAVADCKKAPDGSGVTMRAAKIPHSSVAGKEYQKGDPENAQEYFKSYVATHPRDWRIRKQWAEFESRNGALDHAVEILEKAVEEFSSRSSLWSLLAGLEERCGNRKKAVVVYKKAIQEAGECSCLLLPWAVLEAEVGNVKTARDIFKKVIEHNPTDK